jgi:S1-C subfamily serine protease
LRARVLPRTVLGLALLILAASMGAAFSGAVLFSYYQYRTQQTNDRVNALIGGYKQEFEKASGDLAAQANAAKGEIDSQLGPLRDLQASGQALQTLSKKVAPSVWFVHTLDANGQPSVGTAFAVASTANQTLLLTSYTTVLAATRKPGPDLFVRQGTTDTKVSVWTWDERYDLALIILSKGGVPALSAAPATPAIGDRVYAASGLGSLGASATDGIVTDVSASGIQHSAPIGQAFQGGPILNTAGQVVAVSSRTYSPLNFQSDGVWFAPFIQAACTKVLQCPAGSLDQPGAQRSG